MAQLFADIALPLPLEQSFTYIVPPDLHPHAQVGSRALVPFRRKYLSGVIVGLAHETKISGIKPVKDILDAEPLVGPEMMKLTRWIADYYFAPWGEVLKIAIPQGGVLESQKKVMLTARDVDSLMTELKKSFPRQQAILRVLREHGDLTIKHLQKKAGTKNIHAILNEMLEKGWINIAEEIPSAKVKPKAEMIARLSQAAVRRLNGDGKNLTDKQRAIIDFLREKNDWIAVPTLLKEAKASLSTVKALSKKELVEMSRREVLRTPSEELPEPAQNLVLNSHQEAVLKEIDKAILAAEYRTFLLHGVTGSGKTQVYIEAIRNVLSAGKTAVVLVPEISLTPQMVRRFKSHFGDRVAVMHSQMSTGERYDAWQLAHEGKANIVIGPRSAIFAPLKDIGLIVVDEEQEASYKQFDATPRYNARDVAIVRATNNNAVVILGSATPSAESYQNALSGKYGLLRMPERVDHARLPSIKIVDMTKERKRVFEETKAAVKGGSAYGGKFPKRLPYTSVSKILSNEIGERLRKKEGVILLLNRRGFSHVVECFDCGHVEKCDNCEVSLTYHQTKKHLRCHYCGFVKIPPTVCPECGSVEIRFHSFGTQQVQEELEQLFPNAVIARMDKDTTTRKGAHDRILTQFGSGGADILLGTQMVAKGLDFPRVTLVGVVSADTQMLLPDFRASEHTFQLLTQVAGRAGRSTLAGEVVIQTYQPQHYSLNHVIKHDFEGFYKEELEYRKELDYPPFSRVVLLEFSGLHENEVHHHAKKFAELLTAANGQQYFIVLGPADAAIPKLKNRYRKHVIIKDLKSKDPSGSLLRSALLKVRQQYEASALGKSSKVAVAIDVDPQGMM